MAIRKNGMGTSLGAFDAAAANHHDTNLLTNGDCRALWVGGAGNVKITTLGGNDVTITAAQAGQLIPIGARRVFSTGTTATSILVIY